MIKAGDLAQSRAGSGGLFLVLEEIEIKRPQMRGSFPNGFLLVKGYRVAPVKNLEAHFAVSEDQFHFRFMLVDKK
jgi:hypothetical protein